MHEKIMGLAPNYARRILGLTDVVVGHRISKEFGWPAERVAGFADEGRRSALA
ncbi:MAG: hypothetical protein ACHQX3_03820 [Nitrospirales bacterium]